jgi:hypothetical protein
MRFSERTLRAGCALARAAALVLSVLCLLGGASREAAAQFTQQGAKLVASDAVGSAEQGNSVALSADGNTMIVGGYYDDSRTGAAWVFTRSGGVWTQQGSKLVASDAVGSAEQGFSVALSADGNTAIVGGPLDNTDAGAAWVWTRSGGLWTQYGSKLVGTGAVGSAPAELGYSVALSADGNTAIAGGPRDNESNGAAWVFTLGGGWTQEGSKLVASDAVGSAFLGTSVALSGDGGIAIIGGPSDNNDAGATWVFTRGNGGWTQQGSKLVGTGAVDTCCGVYQGSSVALSTDGNTAIVGGPLDNANDPPFSGTGAAWVFTQSGGVWTQQGSKLVGTGAVGNANQGSSVAVSADGNTLSVGGLYDNGGYPNGVGAAWIFTQGGGWTQQGSKLVGTGAAGDSLQGNSVALSADGDTLSVGGPGDNSSIGAAWVFTAAAPMVTSVSPTSGPTGGGTSVTITGTNFLGAGAAQFGSANATSFTVNSSTSITATAPAGSGTVDITVTTSAGTSATSAADQFSYGAAPTVTAVAPNSGSFAGGTGVTITGTNFTGATAVSFGGNAAISFNVVSATSITATSPAGSGTVDVTVATPGGTSATGAADGFTYITAPAVTAIAPTSGPAAGGTIVTITGMNLSNATAVKFGATAAASFTVNNASSISASSPAGTGTADVTVTTIGGTSATSGADQFSYVPTPTAPTVTAVSPNGGPAAGGTSVTITGTNLTGASAVSFGGTAATRFAVNSATSINAISPAGSVRTVDVTVTTGNGTSATNAADHFTYASPRMTQQGPKLVGSHASGNAEQGISVSLSADGNTAIVGGPDDNASAGAAWIFSRNSALPVVPGAVGAPASASSVAPAAWTQADAKLVGTGSSGAAQQGYAVALSGDGNTAIVGGYNDNAGVGAVWVFTRRGGILPLAAVAGPGSGPALPVSPGSWSQQGARIIASDEVGAGMFGVSVALSSDGNTAIVGGYADSSGTGAAWTFTRSNGVWTQQGPKLVGSGAVANAFQGISVALSGDGNTALMGGYGDNADNGAAWVFVRSDSTWTQVGSKLVGSGNVGAAAQGYAVALSADGNTALVGGFGDNADTGAGWIFTQSGGVWTQAGSKLIGTGAVGTARQGFAAALSADASTAAIAGYEDNTFNGAVWVFSQSGGTWTQFGSKLFGSGAVGPAEQGSALALSANGTTLLEGGPFDNSGAGAAWVFVAPGAGAFTATPNTGQGPLAVTFSASGLTAPMTYTVNFGDGTTGALNQSNCIATAAAGGEGSPRCSASASHAYTVAGSYTATLLNASGLPLGSATVTVNASTANGSVTLH